MLKIQKFNVILMDDYPDNIWLEKRIEELFDLTYSLHNETDSLSDQTYYLKENLRNTIAKQKVEYFLQELSYPYGLEEWLKSTKLYHERSNIEIEQEHSQYIIFRFRKLNNKSLKKISHKFKSGNEFLALSKSSSIHIKPVLLYYALNQIYSGIIDCFFRIDKVSPHHGITSQSKMWKLKISRGFFFKLTSFLEMLTQKRNYFSEIYYENIDYPKNLKIDLTLNKKGLKSNLEEVNWSEEILNQYLFLFALSSYSRYNPSKWLKFLDGKTLNYKTMLRHYSSFYLSIEKMLTLFKSHLSPNISEDTSPLFTKIKFRENRMLEL